MRILVAPQEFKGTLTAIEAAEAIASALQNEYPEAELDLLPMADGGPGTAAALVAAIGGEWQVSPAHDPLSRPIDARWARLRSGVAVIECAAASGLILLTPGERNPRLATSLGTGELIASAIDAGCRDLIVGLGGSATNDGGAGMARALGFRLLDSEGRELPPGGAALIRLAEIVPSLWLTQDVFPRVIAAADVINPLVGPDGASAVYGPQKGADDATVALLDAALQQLAVVVERDLGVDIRDLPMGGAAGGLAAGLVAFLGAELSPGADLVAAAAGLDGRAELAGLVITGEGRLDGQTVFGKAPARVAAAARSAGRRVVCLAGSLGPGYREASQLFDRVEVLGASLDPATALGAVAIRALAAIGLKAG